MNKIILIAVWVAVGVLALSCADDTTVTVSQAVPKPLPQQSCNVEGVPNGAKITCPDGSSQTILDGDSGANGSNGSIITTVQFCPAYVPVYPTTFPEYGLCIDNKLYAVYYSVPGGTFMSYLPPGAYISTSNSATCTFTVVNGCEVVQ